MKIHKTKLALAAAALVAAPVAAQGVEAASARATAPIAGESELAGGAELAPAFIIAAIAGIAMGVLLLTDDDDDQPVSA